MKKFWDAHVHLFPERIFKAIWRWFAQAGWEIPFANWELEQYVAYLQKMGMERAFLLTYAHKPDISLELNRWVREVCQQYSQFIPFACIHPLDTNLEEVIITKTGLSSHGFTRGMKARLSFCRNVFLVLYKFGII